LPYCSTFAFLIVADGAFSMLSQLQKIFQDIYEKNEWGYGSGEGFLEIQTRGYRRFLRHFLLEKKITTVVDMGCGDWQFSQFVDWSGVSL
jgi:hypothetical protein